MNEELADSAASGLAGPEPQPDRPRESWSRQRLLTFVVLVFIAQVAIIFALGKKQFPPPRAMTNLPQLALADNASELIVLDNPALFALPQAGDFAPDVWGDMTNVTQPSFRWTEPSLPAPLASGNLGAVFTRFMQTNQFSPPAFDFKPEPELSEPMLQLQPIFAENSTVQVEGELVQRKWLNPMSLTNWPYADVIAPSEVQVLVDAAGNVISAVLLPPEDPSETASHYSDADQYALALARGLRFAPGSALTVGRLIFDWRTVPPPADNSPAAAP